MTCGICGQPFLFAAQTECPPCTQKSFHRMAEEILRPISIMRHTTASIMPIEGAIRVILHSPTRVIQIDQAMASLISQTWHSNFKTDGTGSQRD